MLIRRIDGLANVTEVAHVESYEAAHAYLSKLGRVIAFDLDTFAGGADVLVVPRGFSYPDQYAIEQVS